MSVSHIFPPKCVKEWKGPTHVKPVSEFLFRSHFGGPVGIPTRNKIRQNLYMLRKGKHKWDFWKLVNPPVEQTYRTFLNGLYLRCTSVGCSH